MNSSTVITLWILSIPVFVVVDLLWLGVIAKNFYFTKLGHLFGDVNWYAAALFYALFLLGVTLFVTYPAVQAGSVARAFAYGALFGLVTYATYDLTNQATIKDWPVVVTVVDMVWGAVLGSVVSGVVVSVYRMVA